MPITTYSASPSFSFNGHPFLVCRDLLAQDIIYKLVEPVSIGTIGKFEEFVKGSLGESDFSLTSKITKSDIAQSLGIGNALNPVITDLENATVILKEFEINTQKKTKRMTILFSLPTPIEYLSLSLSGITFTIISEPDGKIQSVDNNTKELKLTLSQKSEWAKQKENASCQLTIFSNQGEIKVNGSLTTDGTDSTDKEVTATIQLASPVDQQNVIKDLMVDITPAKPN